MTYIRNGIEVSSNTSIMLNDSLINLEFNDDRRDLREKYFKSKVEDLKYFIGDSDINFKSI